MNGYARQRGWHQERSGGETTHSMFGELSLGRNPWQSLILLAHESPCACLFPTLHSVMSPSSLESTSGHLCTTEIGKHCRSELSSFQGASLPAHQPLQLRRWLQLDSKGPWAAGPGDSLFSLFAEGFRKTVSSTLPDLREMKQAQNLSA